MRYLVLKSNGLRHSKNPPVKFSFSLKIVPATIAKKLPSQRCSQPFLIAFSTSRTNGPHSLSQMKAGTHSAFGEKSHTTAYTPKQEPSLPRPQHSLELPAKSSPKEQPEEADARLWRVSASSGVAAPLGCVILSLVFQHCVLLLSMWNSHTTQTDWYHHSRLVLHAVEPPTSGHQNGPLVVCCSVGKFFIDFRSV